MTPLAAQMMQHGQIVVLADTSHIQVMNLRNVMHARFFEDNSTEAIEACKLYCYADIHCQHWQLIELTGCWVEDPRTGNSPRYPLVLSERTRMDAREGHATVAAGEFIQHYCSERCNCGCGCDGVCEESEPDRSRRRRSRSVAQEADVTELPHWFWPLLGSLLLCCLLCLLCFLCRESTSRSVELEENSDDSPRSARVIATTHRSIAHPAPAVPVYAAGPSQSMLVGSAPPSSFASRAMGTAASFTTGAGYQAVSSYEPTYQSRSSYEPAYRGGQSFEQVERW